MILRAASSALALGAILVACGTSTSSSSHSQQSDGGTHGAGASGDSGRPGGGGGAGSGGLGAGGLGNGGANHAGMSGAGTQGAGAGNGATAGNGLAGASAGAGALGRSQTEACMAYVGAFCTRLYECSGDVWSEQYPCAKYCPDVEFAPGSTRTVDGLFACADVYAHMSCEDLNAAKIPDCAAPGTKQVGEPCVYNAECQSLLCRQDDAATCGMCGNPVNEGGDCSAPDTACTGDLICKNGICSTQIPDPKQPGEACADYTECGAGNAFCNEQGICELYPGEGESCKTGNHCRDGVFCAAEDWICRVPPGLDAPCANDAAGGARCAAGLSCTTAQPSDGGTCVEPVTAEAGEACGSNATQCTHGSACTCVDPACTDRRCMLSRLLGETCGDGLAKCNTPLDCKNGVCVDPGYRGDYEAVCSQ